MSNLAERYREDLYEEMYMELCESRSSYLSEVLKEEWRRVKEKEPVTSFCSKCHHYERPPQVCNLCRKGQIAQLEIELADLFKEYQDLAGIHNLTCNCHERRITDLEITLRATRGRMVRKGMTTLMIDGVLVKKGD